MSTEAIPEKEVNTGIKESNLIQHTTSVQLSANNGSCTMLSDDPDSAQKTNYSEIVACHKNINKKECTNPLERCIVNMPDEEQIKPGELITNSKQQLSDAKIIGSNSKHESENVLRHENKLIDQNLTNNRSNILIDKSNNLTGRNRYNTRLYFKACYKQKDNKTLLYGNLERSSMLLKKNFKKPVPKKSETIFHKLNDIKKSRLQKQTKLTSIKCKFCNKRFHLQVDLKRHLKRHTQKYLYECSQCSKSYIKIFYLQRHLQKHKDDNKNKRVLCVYSKKLYSQTKNLIGRDEQVNNSPCQNCNKWFLLITQLKKRVDSRKKKYNCNHCDKIFERSSALKTHITKVHLLEKRFLCSICGKTFATLNSVNKHERNHDVRDHACKDCSECLSKESQRKSHNKLNTHNGFSHKLYSALMSYLCLDCGEQFNKFGTMMQHLRFHDDAEEFHCLRCNEKFKGLSDFTSHTEICTNKRKRRTHKFNLHSGKRNLRSSQLNSRKVLSSEIDNVKIVNISSQMKQANNLIRKFRKFQETMSKSLERLNIFNHIVKTAPTDDLHSAETGTKSISSNPDGFSFYDQNAINKKNTPIVKQPKYSKKVVSVKNKASNITDNKNASYNQKYEKKTPKKNLKAFCGMNNITISFMNALSNNKNKPTNDITLSLHTKGKTTDLADNKIKSVCTKTCNQKNQINYNLRLRPSIKKCKCKACKESVRETLSKFNDIFHVSKDNYACSLCNTVFTQSVDLMVHMRKHLEDEPYLHRQDDDNEFANYMTIRPKSWQNPESKQYICSICDRVFRKKDTFEDHMSTHPEPKKYKCLKCDYEFELLESLNSHCNCRPSLWAKFI